MKPASVLRARAVAEEAAEVEAEADMGAAEEEEGAVMAAAVAEVMEVGEEADAEVTVVVEGVVTEGEAEAVLHATNSHTKLRNNARGAKQPPASFNGDRGHPHSSLLSESAVHPAFSGRAASHSRRAPAFAWQE